MTNCQSWLGRLHPFAARIPQSGTKANLASPPMQRFKAYIDSSTQLKQGAQHHD